MKIFLTGANGFTGKHLSSKLKKEGHEVITYSSNILDENMLQSFLSEHQPEAVAHLAAKSFVHTEDIKSVYETNITGTYNLLNAIYKTIPNIKSILLASSATVYGHQEGILDERSATIPSNDYGVSKLAMEQMAKLWISKLPIFILRPFNYTGPGQAHHFVIPKIVEHFKKRKDVIELGNIDVWREFQDIRDIIHYYTDLLINPPIGQIINICSGKSYSLREIIKICEEIMNHRIEISVNQKFIRKNEIKELKGNPNLLLSKLSKTTECFTIKKTLSNMLTY